MYYSKIKQYEENFKSNLTDGGGNKYTLEEITENGLTFNRIRPVGYESYYNKEETSKDLIVLHLTEGYLHHDITQLCGPDNTVCTNFIIGKYGEIYELFDQKYWGWHLGRGSAGGNKINSARSFSIELSNVGIVDKKGDFFYDYGSKYCSVDDTKEYISIDTPYRGQSHFASFTDAQYKSLQNLIDYLCNKYGIPKEFLPEDKRYDVFESSDEARSYSGICTHANYRIDKFDIGPAFDWSRFTKTTVKAVEPPKPSHVDEDIEVEKIKNMMDDDEDIILDTVEVKPNDEPISNHSPKKKSFIEIIFDIINSLIGRSSL